MEHTHHEAPKNNNKLLMSVLAYLGLLVIIPYLVANDDPFVKFHIKQGFVLLCIEIAAWIIGMIVWLFWPVVQIVDLVCLILSIIGIINVAQNKEKSLPIVGQYSHYFKI